MRAKASSKDVVVALGSTLLGGVLLFLAMRARWSPMDMLPGVEGTLTAGVVATVLLLLQPIPFARAMLYSAPILAIEYWAMASTGAPAVGILGVQLLIVGFIGLALATRAPSRAAEASREAREAAEQQA